MLTRRLERAAALLRGTDHSVARICAEVGLRSLGSFTTSFTRTYGRSPAAYRAEQPPMARGPVPTCVLMAHARPRKGAVPEKTAAATPPSVDPTD